MKKYTLQSNGPAMPLGNLLSNGFTMVELLVSVFIFSGIMILATSSLSLGFMSGRLHSTSSQEASRSMNLLFDIIGQKMANANGHYSGGGENYYGFKVLNPEPGNEDIQTLVIVSKNIEGDTDRFQCTYIGKRDAKIMMAQKECGESLDIDGVMRFTPNLNNQITSDSIEVSDFTILPDAARDIYTYEYNSEKKAPYLTVSITLKDTKLNVDQTARTTYNIPYLTYSQWD